MTVSQTSSVLRVWTRPGFSISTDPASLDLPRIHAFLSGQAYWSKGIPESTVRRSVEGSLCFGLFAHEGDSNTQCGFARVVTDAATFAWVCDVYVEEPFRWRGLAHWLMTCVLEHPALSGLRRICLATRDAHALYEGSGFTVTKTPGYWMEIKDAEIYVRGPG